MCFYFVFLFSGSCVNKRNDDRTARKSTPTRTTSSWFFIGNGRVQLKCIRADRWLHSAMRTCSSSEAGAVEMFPVHVTPKRRRPWPSEAGRHTLTELNRWEARRDKNSCDYWIGRPFICHRHALHSADGIPAAFHVTTRGAYCHRGTFRHAMAVTSNLLGRSMLHERISHVGPSFSSPRACSQWTDAGSMISQSPSSDFLPFPRCDGGVWSSRSARFGYFTNRRLVFPRVVVR